MKYKLLALLFLVPSCTSYTDLGSNFKLYQYGDRDVYVGYCFHNCEKSSIIMIPPTVVDVHHDANWIIAKVVRGDSSYWIIEKYVEIDFCYDCGFGDSLRERNLFGPLNYGEFMNMLEEKAISLRLRE